MSLFSSLSRLPPFCLLVAALLCASLSADPQVVPTPSSVGSAACSFSCEDIEARIKQIREQHDLDEPMRGKAISHYQVALAELKRAEALTQAAVQFRQQIAAVDQKLQDAKTVDKSDNTVLDKELSSSQLEELQRLQTQLDEQEALLKQQLADLDEQSKQRFAKRKEIRNLLISAPERMTELKKQLQATPMTDELPLVAQARQMALQAQLAAMQKEVPALEAELASYDAEDAVDLKRQQRDQVTRQLEYVSQHLQQIDDRIKELRKLSDAQRVEAAKQDKMETEQVLAPLAARNLELAQEEQQLTHLIAQAEGQLKEVQLLLEELRYVAEQTQKKVDHVGLTGSIGLALRRQRTLPLMRLLKDYRKNTEQQSAIKEVQLKVFEYDEERSQLADLAPIIKVFSDKARDVADAQQLKDLEADAEELLKKQRDYLDAINHSYSSYFDLLAERESAEKQLIKEANNYRAYIDERVLWIRSGEALSLASLPQSWHAFEVNADIADWYSLGQVLWQGLTSNPFLKMVTLLAIFILLFCARSLARELERLGLQAERSSSMLMGPTLRATLVTLLLAAPGPALICYLAWQLEPSVSATKLSLLLSTAFWRLATIYFILEFLRQMCRPEGLLQMHFDWPGSAVKALKHSLKTFMIYGLPLLGVMLVLRASDPEQSNDGIERLCFIVLQVILARFIWQVWQPGGPIMQEAVAFCHNNWFEHLKNAFLGALLCGPLFLAALAYFGYYFTAQNLALRLQDSILLLLCLWFIRALLQRWLLVYHRRLAMLQNKELNAAANENDQGPLQISAARSEKKADLATVSSQANRLIGIVLLGALLLGTWFIWLDVLPALNVLDRVALGSTNVKVIEQKVLPNGSIEQVVSERLAPITLRNLCEGLIFGVLTFAAARNAPGLLDMALLLRLPLDAPVRYAIRSIFQYVIVMLGIAVSFNAVGIGWSQVQWLVAAISLGLGFGLQEIFANFVSGLIILFERPVRVGDVVTIDNISGVVSRIGTRATAITNWERKEFIVPNKELITGKLLNWTLTDTINRIAIEVGVAYGTDTAKACALLLDIAKKHPIVMKDPGPLATFEGFGDSTLKCVLRVFLPCTEKRLEVIHQLHTAIDDVFREANIEIAFPQREVHIRSMPEPTPLKQGTTFMTH